MLKGWYSESMPLDITNTSIQSYMDTIPEPRKQDITWIVSQMEKITQRKPKLWGSIIGFGRLYYRYPTGNDGYMPILGLSNRKQAITLYLSFTLETYLELKKLGKHKTGKSCLYLQRLADVDRDVLITMMKKAYQETIDYAIVKVLE
jgi:hypothetical protein